MQAPDCSWSVSRAGRACLEARLRGRSLAESTAQPPRTVTGRHCAKPRRLEAADHAPGAGGCAAAAGLPHVPLDHRRLCRRSQASHPPHHHRWLGKGRDGLAASEARPPPGDSNLSRTWRLPSLHGAGARQRMSCQEQRARHPVRSRFVAVTRGPGPGHWRHSRGALHRPGPRAMAEGLCMCGHVRRAACYLPRVSRRQCRGGGGGVHGAEDHPPGPLLRCGPAASCVRACCGLGACACAASGVRGSRATKRRVRIDRVLGLAW